MTSVILTPIPPRHGKCAVGDKIAHMLEQGIVTRREIEETLRDCYSVGTISFGYDKDTEKPTITIPVKSIKVTVPSQEKTVLDKIKKLQRKQTNIRGLYRRLYQ